MRTLLRALLAVVMLAGFYVLALGVVGGLAALDVAVVASGKLGFAVIKLLLVTVPVILTVFSGVLMIGSRSRRGEEGMEGVRLTEAEQPELWAKVRRVAASVGTRPPDEIRLVSLVNAGVTEKARLLGLIPGRRLLFVGVPLMAGLTERELESVLAHEFGHYANRDTRLSGITYRGRAAIIHTLQQIAGTHGPNSILAKIFLAYAKLYFRVSEAVCRRQELAADAASVRVAGRAATVSSLGKIRPLGTVWAFYQDTYVGIGVASGYLPREVMHGFSQVLADPGRQGEMRKLVEEAPPEAESPYDSHPPISRRVALIEAGDPGPAPDGPDRPAPELIRDAGTLFEAVFTESLNAKGRSLQRLEWAEFMNSSVRGSLTVNAKATLVAAGVAERGAPDLASLLGALEAGKAMQLAGLMPGSGSGTAATAQQREALRTRLREGVTAVAWLALADAGKARWEVSWSELASITVAEGFEAELGALIDAAVAEVPDVGPLREMLAAAGVPERFRI